MKKIEEYIIKDKLRPMSPYYLVRRMYIMTKLRCSDYGFECDYIAEGKTEQVIDDFKEHMLEEHGIDYSKETIMQFVTRENEYP